MSLGTPVLRKEAVLTVPITEVWKAWTNTEGVIAFFAPEANIQLAIGEPYELYFDLRAPLGFRGTEGCKVLAFNTVSILSFDWIAPPEFPNVRRLRTRIDVRFEELQRGGLVKLSLAHSGFQEGEEWDDNFEYSDWWWDLVLGRLQHRFSSGPIDWRNPYRPAGIGPAPEHGLRDHVPSRA